MSLVDLLNQSLGFIVGIVASWIFMYSVQFLKPKLEISPVILYNPEKNTLNIKVVNAGRRQVIDVETGSSISQKRFKGDGFKSELVKELEILGPLSLALNPLQDLDDPWAVVNGRIFRIRDGIEALLLLHEKHEGERRVIFRIVATHSLSGVREAQQVTYKLNDVRVGIYGRRLTVLEQKNGPSIAQLIEEAKAKQANP